MNVSPLENTNVLSLRKMSPLALMSPCTVKSPSMTSYPLSSRTLMSITSTTLLTAVMDVKYAVVPDKWPSIDKSPVIVSPATFTYVCSL